MAKSPNEQKLPVINCHAHVFNGPQIPPYIGKTFMPWPLYKLFSIPFVLWACKKYYSAAYSPYKIRFEAWYKDLAAAHYTWRITIIRSFRLRFWIGALNFVIAYHGIVYFIEWLTGFFIKPAGGVREGEPAVIVYLKQHDLLFNQPAGWFKLLVFLFTIFFIRSGRRLVSFILKNAWAFLSILPDKSTIAFIGRYINIGRFAYYKTQKDIFNKLKYQYPPGTGFILLPMDMVYMDAGELQPDGAYDLQMQGLLDIKNTNPAGVVFPFVFVDPRRTHAGGKVYVAWKAGENGSVILEDCFIRDYIETHGFSGFKIYPALGYYPFDKKLLALWKYAADRQLPITTHCIRGTIFFRGMKQKSWDHHPVFMEYRKEGKPQPMLLSEIGNVDFINNFTHPLNYLCLVEERLLRQVVATADQETKDLFGFIDRATALKYDLRELKLCFGHYGGDDEWAKYFDKDRDALTSQIVREPGKGIVFCKDGDIGLSYGTLEQIWRTVDWYTIISSMMLQYPNLYADISNIIHNDAIFPLLKSTLQNAVLQKKVLFGTDFYVVRNHKSDKEMLADLEAALTTVELDLIARENPRRFLKDAPLATLVEQPVI
ncbi:amidohydrolase family protein [Mucilaginibacter sp.]